MNRLEKFLIRLEKRILIINYMLKFLIILLPRSQIKLGWGREMKERRRCVERIKSAEFVSMYLHNKGAHIAVVTMREYRSVIFQGGENGNKVAI